MTKIPVVIKLLGKYSRIGVDSMLSISQWYRCKYLTDMMMPVQAFTYEIMQSYYKSLSFILPFMFQLWDIIIVWYYMIGFFKA